VFFQVGNLGSESEILARTGLKDRVSDKGGERWKPQKVWADDGTLTDQPGW